MRDEIDLKAARCEGKEAYRTAALANIVAGRRQRKVATLKAYRCEFCGFYHIGNSKRRRGLRRSRQMG